MIRSHARAFAVMVVLLSAVAASAQETQIQPQASPPVSFTLEQALQYAIDHYPTVRAALEQVNVSTAGVSVAKSAYLPRLDSLWQSNRGTANNIFGQVLPQSVIPAMSGPVLPSSSGGSVWGVPRAHCSPGNRSTLAYVRPPSSVRRPQWLVHAPPKRSRGSMSRRRLAPPS